MSILHILHGLPGSGKSTLARSLQPQYRAIILAHDEWMLRLYGCNPPAEHFADYSTRIDAAHWALACQLLGQGIDVIWDYGVWTRSARARMLARAQVLGVEALFYDCQCDPAEADARVLRRNVDARGQVLDVDQPALDLFRSLYEPIAEDEGLQVMVA
ncbi:AAA family ATPase [Uliginosibacterium gangwonense]|uniref:AAA family ATPase n=1 Tax=Uliginosibacterium gangwonense TaxID=392736 RepID=UPI000369A43A|nr:ATP-binding protein [Uliginosibacterium gangwonense]